MTSELINYVGRYGGFCRDCADNLGTCPLSGMPCDPKQQTAVIKHTIEALKYGIEHGFIESPFAVKVPDVPELVRYSAVRRYGREEIIEKDEHGKYVLHSQAAEIIAAKDAEIEKLNEQNDKFKWQVRDTCTRAEAAEAKLAQIEKQEAVATLHISSTDTYPHIEVEVHNGETLQPSMSPIKVYTAPVTSDADLRAESQRLREAAKHYLDAAKGHFHESDYVTDGDLAKADAELFILLNPSETKT